jgi:hypothetical protein
VVSAGFISILKADAEEGTCIFEASNQDVFVMVWDQDEEGNKGAQIWQGRINQGESAKITAPHGQIRYSYNDQNFSPLIKFSIAQPGDGSDRKNFDSFGKRPYILRYLQVAGHFKTLMDRRK